MKSQNSGAVTQFDSKRLQRFMLAAPAAAAAVGGATVAEAGVVHFDVPTDKTISGNTGSFTIGNINLASGGSYNSSATGVNFTIGYATTEKPRVSSGYPASVQFATNGTVYGMGASLFNLSATIDGAAATWGTTAYFDSNWATNGSWQNGAPTSGYVGLRLINGGNYNYGWAAITYNDVANVLTLTEFAFESQVNIAVAAGAIPEPANAALLLAAGAAGVIAFRRRKREEAAA
jgi:hypothetical protein